MSLIDRNPQSELVGARLLVVDDEPAVLKLIKGILERAQYNVSTASDGRDALKQISDGSFDGVITDAIMPIMDGYDLVTSIRRQPDQDKVPILMLTRKRQREDVQKAVAVGVTDYVLKPIDEYLLLEKVALCLKKSGGTRQFFECPIDEPVSRSKIELPCKIIAMSEADLTTRMGIPFQPDIHFNLKTRLFEEIGIPMPVLRVASCEKTTDIIDAKLYPYEIKFAFIGTAEADLKKIRAWLQKQSLRRRK